MNLSIMNIIQLFLISIQLLFAINVWASTRLLKRYNKKFNDFSFYVNMNENFWERMFFCIFLYINLKRTDDRYKYLYLKQKFNYNNAYSIWLSDEEKNKVSSELNIYERIIKVKRLKKKSSKFKLSNILSK